MNLYMYVDMLSQNPCDVYALFTLVVTTLWVYYGGRSGWSFSTLAWAMFFPALFAPWFAEQHFFYQVIGFGKTDEAIRFAVFGGLFSIGIITGCIVVNYMCGWGTIDERAPVADRGDLITGFLRAAGEEIGWRCYLLPCLVARYKIPTAFLISGIIWGLYHVPVMLLLSRKLKPPKPKVTIFVQFLSCVISAFPHGWLAVKSGYSMWGPTLMHYTWNRISPIVLGSIYTQTQGKVKGPLWLINSEGVAGCIVMLPLAATLAWDLTK